MTYEEALYLLTDWFHSYKDHNGVQVHERHITPEYREAEEKIRELIHINDLRNQQEESCPAIDLEGLKPAIKVSYDPKLEPVLPPWAELLGKIERWKKIYLFRLTENTHTIPDFGIDKKDREDFLIACFNRLCKLEDIIFGTPPENTRETEL